MTPTEATERVATLRRVIESDLDGASECMVPITATPELVEALAQAERAMEENDGLREDRTREYDLAGADAETAAKRVRGLIHENEALHKWHTALREIARAVAERSWYTHSSTLGGTLQQYACCPFCEKEVDGYGRDIPHTPDCPVTKARALLGEEP